ncbi:MAG: hypothetical protein J6P54_07515 [Bacteroidales bacterium]|nr:hypothetical protein [Bacteroidales bacterium]
MSDILPILEEKFVIPSYFVDENAQLTVSCLFRLLQEMSNKHASLLGAGWYQLREKGYFWVITKIQLNIHRLPRWEEQVTLRSWVKKSNAATSPRDYEMVDADGNVLVAGSSIWAILDIANSHPQHMQMFDGCFLPQDRNAIDQRPKKIGPLALPEEPIYCKEVAPSDIDMNRHVNNAHYIQWTFDAVSQEFRNTHRITDVTVNFISQAKLGDRYAVFSQPISETGYQTVLYSPDNNQEYCRILTDWESINQ